MPKRRSSPTMKDVAKRVNLSLQTVSAVINNKPGITNETRQRVLRTIDEVGYRRYSIAASLRTGRTKTLALILPDIANPAFSAIASAAEDYAHMHNYSLVLYNTHDNPEREASYIRTASERWIDGVLFVCTRDDVTSLEALREAGIPCVAIDRIPQEHVGPSVTLDNIRAGFIATEHLIGLGHKHIAHICGPLELRLARERRQGFLDALQAHDLQPSIIVCCNGWSYDEGNKAMFQVINQSPITTAVFAASDRLAIGAMQAAYQRGISIPDGFSIIGLDNIESSEFSIPPLTTVNQSFSELATSALQILLNILADEETPATPILLEPTIVVRQSTTTPRIATH